MEERRGSFILGDAALVNFQITRQMDTSDWLEVTKLSVPSQKRGRNGRFVVQVTDDIPFFPKYNNMIDYNLGKGTSMSAR